MGKTATRGTEAAFWTILAAGMIGMVALAGCSTSSLVADAGTPAGQLFCAIATGGGDTIVAGIIDAAATSVGAGPVAVLATGATSAAVQADCAAAAAATGGTSGVPVSPPASPSTAPTVAIATVAK